MASKKIKSRFGAGAVVAAGLVFGVACGFGLLVACGFGLWVVCALVVDSDALVVALAFGFALVAEAVFAFALDSGAVFAFMLALWLWLVFASRLALVSRFALGFRIACALLPAFALALDSGALVLSPPPIESPIRSLSISFCIASLRAVLRLRFMIYAFILSPIWICGFEI